MAQTHKHAIFFNGPPHSGKDLAVQLATAYITRHASYLRPEHMKMAAPLKAATHALFNTFFGAEAMEADKDKPSADFMGMSPRQAYIKVSEEMVKPVLGETFFGQIAARHIRQQDYHNVFLFSDAGFVHEVRPTIVSISPANVTIVEIVASRDGVPLTYEGDSRGYIANSVKEQYPAIRTVRIPNDYTTGGSKELFNVLVTGAVKIALKITDGTE